MITEFFNIVLEVDQRRSAGEGLDTISDVLDNFQVVFNDAVPPPLQVRRTTTTPRGGLTR